MVEKSGDTRPEYSAKQLEIVEERMKHHVVKFWSLPLAYVSVVSLTFANVHKLQAQQDRVFVALALIAFGLTILFAMAGAYEGARRAINHIIRLEKELGLVVTVRLHWLHFVPYIVLTFVGIGFSVFLACCSQQDVDLPSAVVLPAM